MQPIVYCVAVSIDGFIAGPAGAIDRFSYEGDHVSDYLAELGRMSVAVMGRRTWQLGFDQGVINPYPQLETWVFSRSLAASPHPNVQLAAGDVGPVLTTLREQQGRGIMLIGGGVLAKQALAAGLVDEVVLKVNPFVMGDGLPLFERGAPATPLTLRSTKAHRTGVVVLRYGVDR